ncbi:putative bifunctional diguanylate cyclase/phosphodiesterase [Natronospira bacteriovora]|uniref:Bifunctional diguanylate cyclase/phosphodiesterase n=1 Tax=Natronospira bacteriovora TaxID=3069753 RepID=A0ABU0W8D5_9GAMM|nr:bifunctional diguanylate cyclase/phosphodiesterase [Natronospira sp. AB-CW4]MDQ2070279.1 bifunctional diguanylate cyclase/phosphodiesterase [Natronospira sp. AB-CW4]
MSLQRFLWNRQPAAYALILAILYVVIGWLWIAFSDQAVARLTDDPATLSQLQSIKGFFFVLFTGALFFLFAYWMGNRLLRSHRLAEWSRRDPMTGLASRAQLIASLRQLLDDHRQDRPQVGVIILDISRFRRINEGFGIRAGDGALLQIAHRLRGEAPPRVVLGRPGSDHFVALVPPPCDSQSMRDMADRLLQATSSPFVIGGRPIRLRIDAAIAMAPQDGSDPQTLLQTASTAIYDAKREEERGIAFSRTVGSQERSHAVSLESDLSGALERGEFALHFQAQTDLMDGRITGCEALLRWQHPDYGLVGPDRFIPLLEETGQIVEVGQWVMDEACRHLAEWQTIAGDDFRMGINLSRRQLWESQLPQRLENARRPFGLESHQLLLEVTETLAMREPAITRSVLDELHGMGYVLALDDFGSGYSCLAYLKEYPLNVVKIDRAFVSGIPGNRKNLALIEIMMGMERPFDIAMVAEGVETAQEAEALLSLGCRSAQGYWIARPVPANEFGKLLNSSPLSLETASRPTRMRVGES